MTRGAAVALIIGTILLVTAVGQRAASIDEADIRSSSRARRGRCNVPTRKFFPLCKRLVADFLPTGRARRARLFKNVRSPIPMQGPVIDEPTISRARTTESCFWLRLPAICMTFDPSPTRVPDLSTPLSLHPSLLPLPLSFPPPFLTRLESPVRAARLRRLYLFL